MQFIAGYHLQTLQIQMAVFLWNEQIRKAKIFLDTYDLNIKERELLPQMMADRLTSLISYMKNQAKNGNEDFQKNIA
jgi:hypothetical protein